MQIVGKIGEIMGKISHLTKKYFQNFDLFNEVITNLNFSGILGGFHLQQKFFMKWTKYGVALETSHEISKIIAQTSQVYRTIGSIDSKRATNNGENNPLLNPLLLSMNRSQVYIKNEISICLSIMVEHIMVEHHFFYMSCKVYGYGLLIWKTS